MTGDSEHRSSQSIPVFAAFVPFGILLIYNSYPTMPLRWVSLVALLESISLFSIYVNIMAHDLLWCMFGIWTFVTVCRPVYFNVIKAQHRVTVKKSCDAVTFAKLFKICSNAIFSDYRIALTAAVPLVIQVLAGGSILYRTIGCDWVMHALAGFGVGATAFKAYKTALTHYGYTRLTQYFRLNRLRFPKAERKTASLEFTLFSLVTVATIWEIFEIILCLVAPNNLFRVKMEPLWNIIGDMFFAITGGTAAWYLIKSKLKWF